MVEVVGLESTSDTEKAKGFDTAFWPASVHNADEMREKLGLAPRREDKDPKCRFM